MGDIVHGDYPTNKPTFTLDQTANNNDDLTAVLPEKDCGIVISDTVDRSRQVEIYTGLIQCMERLQDGGFPVPAAANQFVVAELPVGDGRGQVLISVDATSVTDGNIAVAYGRNFISDGRVAGTDSLLFNAHVRLLADAWLERVGKLLTGS